MAVIGADGARVNVSVQPSAQVAAATSPLIPSTAQPTHHETLLGRDEPDQHPIEAITGLAAALAAAGGGGGGGPVGSITDLSDVDTATDPPAVDDVLAWNGTKWTPATLEGNQQPGGGGGPHGATHGAAGSDPVAIDASQVVSGVLHASRVASGAAPNDYVPVLSGGALSYAPPPAPPVIDGGTFF